MAMVFSRRPLWLIPFLACAPLLLLATNLESSALSTEASLRDVSRQASGAVKSEENGAVQSARRRSRRRRRRRKSRRRGSRRRKSPAACAPYRNGKECPCDKFEGCPKPCKAKKKCQVCQVWNDIIKEFDEDGKAQYGHGFPDPWILMASHQCFEFNHCTPVKDEYGDILPGDGGPFKDPKYQTVPFGRKCTGEPAGGWGNLEKCATWKDCFDACLKKSNKATILEKSDEECNLLHYEVNSGMCTSFTTKECKHSGSSGPSKYSTEKAEGYVVMKAYQSEQVAHRIAKKKQAMAAAASSGQA